MLELSRTIRFSVPLTGPTDFSTGGLNGCGGIPPMRGLGAYYELEVRCRGEADPETGYLVNISTIDAAARRSVLPIIARAVRGRPESGSGHSPSPGMILREAMAAMRDELGPMVTSLRWRLTPYHALSMSSHDPDTVLLSQQFEFAAAHRLARPSMSEAENRAIFGKCAGANSHGHNYRVEPLVAVPLPPPPDTSRLDLEELERIVDQRIIQRFDHKHLNLDTEEFRELNPSVEHIAKICHDLLAGPIGEAGGRLVQVSVWETEKTRCTYPAPGA